MEKTLQRQLLEMLQTLEEGIRYIGKEGNPAMLRECITAIRAIRETCQQSLPIRRQAVYIDLFDGMAQALQQLPDQAGQATLQQATDLCQELIEYARQALQKELTRKKIMVFLPYKASMWDSLESVWKAAYEDKEHCETYVIPIPYCDRNPDMTAKEWHCEAGLFPDYVPVLDWREYSRDKLREMHPDVIFIHNPYDNFNAVTSVDMQYYSRNLKGIAEKLVYIPYFVVGDTIAPHFCQTQGVINADYVIVQDENIKEQYERYYPGGNPPKGKILALGSPKFDKVCNTSKDDYDLPEEWQRLIGNKKVILYNTSLTAMLEHTDKFNAKLRYVFDTFKQRDDVVLWWRPHPLLRATIDSMTPVIRDEYRQIEQAYINEGWGIYDDTPDMDRSIVCTDAYYGDMSSLVWLYRATGKPIEIEDLSALGDYCDFKFYNFIEEGENLFFYDACREAIYSYNRHDENLTMIAMLPKIFKKINLGYGFLEKVNDKFIILPLQANNIIEYDSVEHSFKTVYELNEQYMLKPGAISKCVRYKNKRYFLPIRSFEIIEFDMNTEKYISLTKWFDFVKPFFSSNESNISANDIMPSYYVKENKLFLPIPQGNLIVEMDMDTDQCVLYRVGSTANRYQAMTYDGKCFWLISRNSLILTKWNPIDNTSMEYDIAPMIGTDTIPYYPYSNISYKNGIITMYPGMYKHYTKISVNKMELLKNVASRAFCEVYQRLKDGVDLWTETVFPDIEEFGTVMHFDYGEKENIVYFSKLDVLSDQTDSFQTNYVYFENRPVTLEKFIENYQENQLGNLENNTVIGKRIYVTLIRGNSANV